MMLPTELTPAAQHTPPTLTTSIERVVVWLASELALIGAVAWVAFQIQQEAIAPALLFPLAVGAVLGGVGAMLVRAIKTPSARVAIATAFVAGLLVVVGQDYIGHRYRVRQLADQMSRQEPLAQVVAGADFGRPEFAAYLEGKVRGEPLWWTLDALLTCLAAGGTTAWILVGRRPLANSAAGAPRSLP